MIIYEDDFMLTTGAWVEKRRDDFSTVFTPAQETERKPKGAPQAV